MKYGHMEGVERPVSRLIFGCAGKGFQTGQRMDDLLNAVLDAGINTLDTARVYKQSEETIGRWLEDSGRREEAVLLTKGCHPSHEGEDRFTASDLVSDLEQSFELLRTDYIDIYLLHRDYPDMDFMPILEVLNEYHKKGRIGAFGGSNWTHERIEAVNRAAEAASMRGFTVSSPHFGLADQVKDPYGGKRGCVTLTGEGNQEARDWYRRTGMPVAAYASLAGGLFSGKVRGEEPERAPEAMNRYALHGYAYPVNFERLKRCEILAKRKGCTVAQLATAWMLVQGMDVYPIIGTSRPESLSENIGALEVEVSEEESRFLKNG